MRVKKTNLNVFLLLFALTATVTSNSQTPSFDSYISIGDTLCSNDTLHPFNGEIAFGLGLTAEIELNSDKSYVRIIVSDVTGLEYVLYESYTMIDTIWDFCISQASFETTFLDGFQPDQLIIQLKDAEIHIQKLDIATQYVGDAGTLQRQAKHSKDLEIIDQINTFIQSNNLKWVAGETPYSSMCYHQKKENFGSDYQPIGFEYYVGGFFSPFYATTYAHAEPTYDIVQSFDWRDRHDADVQGSYYFDGDVERKSGWMTDIKCQAGCWVNNNWECPEDVWRWEWPFEVCEKPPPEGLGGEYREIPMCATMSSFGAVEGLLNIYYNDHYDYDLSEQQFLATGGDCWIFVGLVQSNLIKIRDVGVVEEDCFEFEGDTLVCNLCPQGNYQRIFIQDQSTTSFSTFVTEELKRDLIANGPQVWSNIFPDFYAHAMVLVGYSVIHEGDTIWWDGSHGLVIEEGDELIGQTYWIFRDSHGFLNELQNGYVYLLLDDDPYRISEIYVPYTWELDPITDRLCRDEDGDGYYNWGIGDKPIDCCIGCPDEMDGNDNDASIGPLDVNGFTTIINSYNMSFEDGFGSWRQSGEDDVDLKIHTGSFMNGGGPNSAQDSVKYLYFKGDEGGLSNIDAILESPEIDFNVQCSYSMDFYYCISDLGIQDDGRSMKVEASFDKGLTWNTVWEAPLNGIEGWQHVSLMLIAGTNKIRFYTKSGDASSWESDMGIDNISINEVEGPSNLIISGDYFLDCEYFACGNIIIEPNSKLTIGPNGIVHMNAGDTIMVKGRGELIVNGGTITDADNGMWKGIEVWGNSSTHQYPDANGAYDQGYLEIKNDALIENAFNAVTLWKPDDWNSMGGIIKAYNSTFKNNRRSVEFMSYQNFDPNSGNPRKNKGYFFECNFVVDDSYIDSSDFAYHVSMWEVDGVKFKGCNFVNSMTSNINNAYGIYTIDAGFQINSSCMSATKPCPVSDIIPSIFSGFYAGIEAMSSGSIYPVYVDGATFDENGYGVKLRASDFATIINDSVFVDNNFSDTINCGIQFGIGVELLNCNDYAVEDNTFLPSLSFDSPSIGVLVNYERWYSDEHGVKMNEIYNNKYDGLSVGNEALGNNIGDFDVGLEYLCNENQNNTYDFYIKDEGIKTLQGKLEQAAGNTFSQNGNNEFGDFNNQAEWSILYFYDDVPPDQEPIYYSEKFDPRISQTGNSCLSNYGTGDDIQEDGLGLTTLQKDAYKQQYYDNLSDYVGTLSLYESLKDGGNTQGVVIDIETSWPDEMLELRDELLEDSPHLSKTVLYATADNTDVFPDAVIFEILAANPDEMRDEEFLSYLAEKENPLPEYYIDILRGLAGNISYKTILQCQLAAYHGEMFRAMKIIIRNELNDSICDIDSVRYWLSEQDLLTSDLQIIDSYIQEKNTSAALSLLNSIPASYDLSSEDMIEFNLYTSLKQLQSNLITSGRNIYMLDSTEKILLYNIADSSNGRAGTQAQNILSFVYGENYCSCPEFPDSVTHKSFEESSLITPISNAIELDVFPNPAKAWTVFEYKLPYFEHNINIFIYNSKGQIEKVIPIPGQHGQVIWDIRDTKPGIYHYVLKTGELSKSGNLVIAN